MELKHPDSMSFFFVFFLLCVCVFVLSTLGS